MMDENQENRIKGEKRFWDKVASGYDHFIWSTMSKSYKEVLAIITGELKPDDIVLDVATGTGLIAFEAAGIAKNVYGIDISPKMLEVAKRKMKKHSADNIEFRLEDVYATSFSNNRFDVVICSNALHMMKEPKSALFEMRRVLKHDGILITPTFCHAENANLKEKIGLNLMRLLRWIGILPHLHRFKRKDILEIIIGAGFTIVEQKAIDPLLLYIKSMQKKT